LVASNAWGQERPLVGNKPLPAAEAHRIEELRKQATDTLARGDLEKARQEFEQILKTLPYDASAERDAARAAEAAGKFEYAAEALEKAHHFGGHEHDPELHYLRGEALYTLGRDEEAEREHHIAELEIGLHPADRASKLWLARIQARKGYVVLADRLYESMLPPPPKFDEEVALNQADAHLMNKDWEGGARVLKRYLGLDPKNVRAREMLAWALEADGDLNGELDVRRSLAEDLPTAVHKKDYGRALERAANFRAASVQYHAALAATATSGDGADTTLATSYERMHYRSTPEVAGGGQWRSDPQAWSWRAQAGGAMPFGAHHQMGALVWRDASQDWNANHTVIPGMSALREIGSVTGAAGYVMFGHRSGGSLLLGADARYTTAAGESAAGQQAYPTQHETSFGGNLELDTPIADNVQVNVHGDLNEQWNDAPVTIEEGGKMTGVTAHLYLFPKDRLFLFDGGVQERHLTLRPVMTGDASPSSNQTLGWAGLDFNLWTDGKRVVRGESLDERLVRRTALSDAAVLAYRHYELWANLPPNFYSRISLYSRASIDNGSFIFRKVVAGGRGGFELHGGLGYDNVQSQTLTQGGAAVVVASSWSTRLLVTYDIVHQTTIGLPGTLQIGWVTFHADL
jgi:tetratricopeptide (TPR) repeat protein